ncbi:cytochrome P450 [Streptomyces chartreusis]|uniref:cytochrome P450 n=1 Tax=Streptomyces chartreusis TaxID=1969 RepID=UPI0037F4FA83
MDRLAPPGLDLGDPDTFDEGPPFTAWDRQRAAATVYEDFSAKLDCRFHSVIGWRESRSFLANRTAFTSAYGVILGFSPEQPDPAGGSMMMVTDGDRHAQLRSAMHAFFTPRRAAAFSVALDQSFREHLRPQVDKESFDFAAEIAWRAPAMVSCAILGVPEADAEELATLAMSVLNTESADRTGPGEPSDRARTEIVSRFKKMAASPRLRAGDSLTACLLAEEQAGRLTLYDVMVNLLSVLVAAHETTRLALTGAMVCFGRNPSQLALLRSSSDRVPPATEEILRWTSPALSVSRTALTHTEVGGVPVDAGEVVTAWLTAANRDPAVYEDPHGFDIGRNSRPHVAFGHGMHHCIGASLARTEISSLLRFLRSEVAGIEIAGDLATTHSRTVWGYRATPIKLISLSPARRHFC